MKIIKHIFVLPRRRASPVPTTNVANAQSWRKTEVLSYVIQAIFSILQFAVVLLASIYAYVQWTGDNFTEIEKSWNSREMQIHRDRTNDAFVCTALTNVRNESQINDYYKTLWESSRPRPPASKDGLAYAGLDDTIFAMQDFAHRARKCVDVKSCEAKHVCKSYGGFLEDFDLTFQLRYRDYEYMYGNDDSLEELNWSSPIAKFLAMCIEKKIEYQDEHKSVGRPDYIKNADESEKIAWKEVLQKFSYLENDRNLAQAWKARACKRMSKTAAEEIADVK